MEIDGNRERLRPASVTVRSFSVGAKKSQTTVFKNIFKHIQKAKFGHEKAA